MHSQKSIMRFLPKDGDENNKWAFYHPDVPTYLYRMEDYLLCVMSTARITFGMRIEHEATS